MTLSTCRLSLPDEEKQLDFLVNELLDLKAGPSMLWRRNVSDGSVLVETKKHSKCTALQLILLRRVFAKLLTMPQNYLIASEPIHQSSLAANFISVTARLSFYEVMSH